MLRRLSERPTLIFNKPPIHEIFETQVYVYPIGRIDGRVKEIEDRKRREWSSRGVRPGLQEMAIELAKNYTSRMVEWQLRNLREVLPEDELKKIADKLTLKFFEDALNNVADRWITSMSG